MTFPPALVIMNKSWQLPPGELKAFWWAVTRSRFTRVVAWRQQLQLMGEVHVSTLLVERTCAARAVIAVLEALHVEGQLRRAQCTRIEEAILAPVRGTAACGPWHALDIVTLAEIGRP